MGMDAGVGTSTSVVGGTWEDRVNGAISGALAGTLAPGDEAAARRALAAERFDELCRHIVNSVLPVLEACAGKLRASGVNAHVHQLLRNAEDRLPRALDIGLRTDKIDRRGPGSLVITAVEGRDVLRVVTNIGPGSIGGEYDERRGTLPADQLNDEVVGGLVADLVERLFA
jgi:hypothetical protein